MSDKFDKVQEFAIEASSQTPQGEEKLPFTEPKLTFVTPKLVKHGDIADITAGLGPGSGLGGGGFFGSFNP